jgi:hypothetical protein
MNKEEYRAKYAMSNNPNKINVLVRFDTQFNNCLYPFYNGETLLYLGEIQNMKGHCIVVNSKGQTFWGFHSVNFVEVIDEIEE